MMVFVFGSNLAGRHGAGAARYARQSYNAIYGQGEGLQGESYGIPTKDKQLRVLSVEEIQVHINTFIEFAKKNSELLFVVSPIGCGLAGYSKEEIAPLFSGAPLNCYFDMEFGKLI